jgi:hypothetical protein
VPHVRHWDRLAAAAAGGKTSDGDGDSHA